MERKLYPSLDIAKFAMAMSILLSHTQNERAMDASGIVHNALAISNFAVPFFFACSAFLFFVKVKTLNSDESLAYWKHFSVRLAKMYLVWTLIYFTFQLASWLIYGTCQQDVMEYFHRLIVYSSYPTIWFLPALWLGMTIVFFMSRSLELGKIVIVSLVLYTILALGECYTNLICQNSVVNTVWNSYINVFVTWRNGLFFATPFITCGYVVAMVEPKLNKNAYLGLAILFGSLFVIESFIIKRYNFSEYTHCGFFLLPATFCLMQWLTLVEIPNKSYYIHLRNLSMLTFLSQRIFLTAIPSVWPQFGSFMDTMNPYLTIAFVATLVIVFSMCIEKLSSRYSSLKILW